MRVVGKIESLWRYPVKSMRGEELQEAFVVFPGVYGDRVYAFRSSAAPEGFPYLTGREQEAMLLYRPRYRHAERATKPVTLADAGSDRVRSHPGLRGPLRFYGGRRDTGRRAARH